MKKSELRQIIREEISKLKEEDDSWDEKFHNDIDPEEYFDRMEGLANERMLRTTKDYLRILTTEWLNENFEKEDIIQYFSNFIKEI